MYTKIVQSEGHQVINIPTSCKYVLCPMTPQVPCIEGRRKTVLQDLDFLHLSIE